MRRLIGGTCKSREGLSGAILIGRLFNRNSLECTSMHPARKSRFRLKTHGFWVWSLGSRLSRDPNPAPSTPYHHNNENTLQSDLENCPALPDSGRIRRSRHDRVSDCGYHATITVLGARVVGDPTSLPTALTPTPLALSAFASPFGRATADPPKSVKANGEDGRGRKERQRTTRSSQSNRFSPGCPVSKSGRVTPHQFRFAEWYGAGTSSPAFGGTPPSAVAIPNRAGKPISADLPA